MGDITPEEPWSRTTPSGTLPAGVDERFIEAAGVRFRCIRGGSGGQRPLVLLHGWPTWSEVWLPVLRTLGTGHPWVAVDLPCQGRSSMVPKGARTLPGYRGAVASLIDTLDLPSFTLVGNSMGGTLAVMAALDRPARVSRLVLLDAAGLTARLPGRTARMYLPFLLPCFFRAPGPGSVRKLLTRAVFFDAQHADRRWIEAMVSSWAPRERRRGLMDTAFALRRPDASVSDVLPKIAVPTLVLSGRQDVQFPWQTAEAAARTIPGAQFAAVESAGHFPMVEQPAEVARLMSGFL